MFDLEQASERTMRGVATLRAENGCVIQPTITSHARVTIPGLYQLHLFPSILSAVKRGPARTTQNFTHVFLIPVFFFSLHLSQSTSVAWAR